MTSCKHKNVKTGRDRCFRGPVSRDENPAAHGGISYTETCLACHQTREVNVNGSHCEEGPWSNEP